MASFYSPKPAAPERKAAPSTPTKKPVALSVPDYKHKKRSKTLVAASAPRASASSSVSRPPRASRSRNAKVDNCEDESPAKRVKTTVKQAAKPRAGRKKAAASTSRQQPEVVEEPSDAESDGEVPDVVASGSRAKLNAASSLPSPPPTASRKRPRDSSPAPTPPPFDLTSQHSHSHLFTEDEDEPVLARAAAPVAATAPFTPTKSTPRPKSTKAKAQRTDTFPTPDDERENLASPSTAPRPYTAQDHQGGTEAGPSSRATDRVEQGQDERMSSPAADLSGDEEMEDEDEEIQYGAYTGVGDSAYRCVLTPRRDASDRLQNLPVSLKSIIETPTQLQSQLNGYHLKPAEPSSPRFAVTSTTARRARPVVDPSTRYPTEHVRELLARVGGVVTGQMQPELEPPKKKGDLQKVAAWPFVAGYEEWEKPLRYAMESVVKDGVGNCLIALGPRGVGKTMVRVLLSNNGLRS